MPSVAHELRTRIHLTRITSLFCYSICSFCLSGCALSYPYLCVTFSVFPPRFRFRALFVSFPPFYSFSFSFFFLFFVFHWPSIFLLAVAHWLFVPSLPPYRSISIRWPVRFLFSFAFHPSRQIRARTDFHVPHRANFGNQAANLRYDAIEFYFISLVPRAIYTMVLCSRHFRPGIDKSDGTFGLCDLRVPLCTVIALRFEIFSG